MTILSKGGFMRLAVRIAEWAGWLTIVDRRLLDSYLSHKRVEIDQRLAKKFDDARFIRSQLCFIRPWCVEVACKDGIVAVRNSSDEKRATVFFSIDEWRVFINGVKKGDFDFLEDEPEKPQQSAPV